MSKDLFRVLWQGRPYIEHCTPYDSGQKHATWREARDAIRTTLADRQARYKRELAEVEAHLAMIDRWDDPQALTPSPAVLPSQSSPAGTTPAPC
jgi:hypothetical protein